MIVVTIPQFVPLLHKILLGANYDWRTIIELDEAGTFDRTTLITFFTPVIIPADVLSVVRAGYNFHGGPPEYPGRDPHDWAIHDGAAEFGVTLHRLAEKVDSGEILLVERSSPKTFADFGEA